MTDNHTGCAICCSSSCCGCRLSSCSQFSVVPNLLGFSAPCPVNTWTRRRSRFISAQVSLGILMRTTKSRIDRTHSVYCRTDRRWRQSDEILWPSNTSSTSRSGKVDGIALRAKFWLLSPSSFLSLESLPWGKSARRRLLLPYRCVVGTCDNRQARWLCSSTSRRLLTCSRIEVTNKSQ